MTLPTNYLILLMSCFFLLSCQPQGELEEVEDLEELTPSPVATDIGKALRCSLEKVYKEKNLSLKRSRTLRFIEKRLSESIVTYGMQSRVEQAHYMAQLIHESDGLSATVERVTGPSWRRLFQGDSPRWSCDDYLSAVDEDDDFFNNRYIYSKNSYRSKFRGRGLIQLTGCFNYLGYYYHRSAKKEELSKSNVHKTYFTYKNQKDQVVQVGMFCSDSTLEKMDEVFQNEGLELSPSPLISQFEETSDELALPCLDRGLREMPSSEFVVDSSLWYWKKCQNSSRTKQYLDKDTPRAVAEVTQCVHGRHPTYDNYQKIDCSKKQAGFRENSYCQRLKAFEVTLLCLKSVI